MQKIIACLALVLGASASLSNAEPPIFSGLGDLPGGAVNSSALAVSADGKTVVGFGDSGQEDVEAFRWTATGGMEGLGDLAGGDFRSLAQAVSADGSVVAGMSAIAEGAGAQVGFEAFIWTQGGGMEGLGFAPGGVDSRATGISADGTVVVGSESWEGDGTAGHQAWRWTQGTGMVRLGDLPGGADHSHAKAVSADGQVVVGQSHNGQGREAFRWTSEDGMVGLGELPGGYFESVANGVSADGLVVVGRDATGPGAEEAFRWEDGVLESLGDLAGGTVYANGRDASVDGSVVVGNSRSDTGERAFVWTRVSGMRDLQDLLEDDHGQVLTGWSLISATAVSDDGRTIVGRGKNPSGQNEAWIVNLPDPAPLFMGLGDLAGGSFSSAAYGISADGWTVVGSSDSGQSGKEAFRWTWSTGMQGLGDLSGGDFHSIGQAVSADGAVVAGMSAIAAGASAQVGFEAFAWTAPDGIQGLGFAPGGVDSRARDISADGTVVVGSESWEGDGTPDYLAWKWTEASGMVTLGDLPGGVAHSHATGVSADGSIVVGQSHNGQGREAFRWTQAGGMEGLGQLPGGNFESVANGISADGSTIVGRDSISGGEEAFRWQAGQMVSIGELPGGAVYANAQDASGDGSIIVGNSLSGAGARAFVWSQRSGMQDLNEVLVSRHGFVLDGWTLTSAVAISDDGRTIVGRGTNPSGDPEAWIAMLPEPAQAMLGLSALATLLWLRARSVSRR